MKIGELSEQSGFSRDTIRYYQELGLFENHVKRGENSYREFSQEALEILKLIEESKHYGFTLRENKALLEVRDDRAQKLQLMKKFTLEKIEKSEGEIERLKTQIERLKTLNTEIEKCERFCTG